MLTMFNEVVQSFSEKLDGKNIYYIDGYFSEDEMEEPLIVAEIIVFNETIQVLFRNYKYMKDTYVINIVEKTIENINKLNNEK